VRLVDADAWAIVLWRSVTLAAVLGAYLGLRHGRRAGAVFAAMGPAGVLSGLLLAGAFIFFILAITHTLVANALVIMSAAPLVSAVLGRIVLGERIRPLTVAAMLAAMAGIAVMVSGTGPSAAMPASLLGSLFAFGTALSFGANIVVLRAARHVDMLPAMCLGGVFAGLAALPFAAPAAVSAGDLGLIVVMGTVQLAFGLFLFLRGTPHLSAGEVGLLTLLETVLAPLWVWVGVGEAPGAATLAGGAIVIAALAAHSALGLRRSKAPVGMA
jgi:drug/metabolite transporter (DMT)-like permease